MTAQRWAHITGVFREALEKPTGERPAFLEEVCGSDQALRRNVEKLLSGEAEPSLASPLPGFLEDGALELAAGETLAQFRIEAKIGEGGMGAVYRAHDTRLRRKVALKLVPPGYFDDPDRKNRLIREARTASGLNHPNIVTIHDIAAANGCDFIVMELIAGETLAEKIACKQLPLARALRYAAQIADALGCAHAAGIVHRDLKPTNIMIAEDGAVKVLDFGLAKITTTNPDAEATDTAPQTRDGLVLGTVGYMSPEQVRGQQIDHRTDIFIFGLILYEMLSGRRAFRGDSAVEVMNAILKEEPPELPDTATPVTCRRSHEPTSRGPVLFDTSTTSMPRAKSAT